METGSILFGAFYLLINLFALSFLYYGFKIYTESYTFNFFVKLILSFLLFVSMWLLLYFIYCLAYEYPLSLKDILEFVLIFFSLLLPLVILFYLLRIEERGFDYKYLKGFFASLTIYLISMTCYDFIKPQISGYNFFYSSILNFSTLLILLYIPYTLKIIYNLLIKKKQIKYPVIFFGIPISFLLTGLATNGFDKTFSLFIDLTLFILFFNVFTFCYWLKKWLVSDSKKDVADPNNKESGIFEYISKKISERFYDREWRIEKSDYPLNDEIKNAIKNSKPLDLENRDLKQLKFMLVCANQELDSLKNDSNTANNLFFTGFTLTVVPLIILLLYFGVSYYKFCINLLFKTSTYEHNFFMQATELISRFEFDYSIQLLISIIMMYIFGTIIVLLYSLLEPNSKIKNIKIKKINIVRGLYELSVVVIIVTLVIKWVRLNINIEDMINLDLSEILILAQILPIVFGIMFQLFGSFIRSLTDKELINANKIILDLNNKIIFYEK